MTPTWLKLESDPDRKKKVKNSFLKYQTMSHFHLFHCSCMQLLSCTTFDTNFAIVFFVLFYHYFYNFHSILLLSDAKEVTNFITYILQIGTLPITKNNSKHLFIILFKYIFTSSIYKLLVVNFVVTINWLFLFIYFNDIKYIYFLIIVYLFCYYYLLIFFRLISL